MSPTEMIDSEAVAVTFGNRILGAFAWLMPLSVTISTFGSANGTLFAAGRYVVNKSNIYENFLFTWIHLIKLESHVCDV